MDNNKPLMLSVSSSPHVHSGENTTVIMQDVLIALIPAALMMVVYFGWRSVLKDGVPNPYVSPALAADLDGLPAAYVDAGSAELFSDEATYG